MRSHLKDIQIRRATPQDLEQLALLFDTYRQFYKQPSNINEAKHFLLERLQQNEAVIFCAFKDERMLGFTLLYPTFSSISMRATWVLNDLLVVPEARNQGIATLLLTTAQQFVRDKGDQGLSLETAMDNPAQKLYERLGWKRDNEFLHYSWKA